MSELSPCAIFSENSPQPNPDLEIIIITFNRCGYLSSTLQALDNSLFRFCKITVLDNFSTDATPSILEHYLQRLPFFSFLTHPRNINGNPNIVRAYEISSSPYLWLLGDDDIINTKHAQQVLEVCAQGVADLINLWRVTVRKSQPTGLHHLNTYIKQYKYLWFDQSFISGVITKTSLITDNTLSSAYDMISSSYPQLVFTIEAMTNEGLIYICPEPVVERSGDDVQSFGLQHRLNLTWYLWWLKISSLIPDPEMRAVCADDGFQCISFKRFILHSVLDFRLRGNELTLHKLLLIMSYQPKARIIYCFLLLPIYLIPLFMLKPIESLCASKALATQASL
jgi:glycosyltransferase involved in cell wall biosynthesis